MCVWGCNAQTSGITTGGDCPRPPPITSLRPQNVANVLSRHTSSSPKSIQSYSFCTAAFQWIYQLTNICSTSNHCSRVWRGWSDPQGGETPQSAASSRCRRQRLSFLWRRHKISPLSALICLWVVLRQLSSLLNHEVRWSWVWLLRLATVCVCLCVCVIMCVGLYVSRLYIWESWWAISSQESTQRQTCHCSSPPLALIHL